MNPVEKDAAAIRRLSLRLLECRDEADVATLRREAAALARRAACLLTPVSGGGAGRLLALAMSAAALGACPGALSDMRAVFLRTARQEAGRCRPSGRKALLMAYLYGETWDEQFLHSAADLAARYAATRSARCASWLLDGLSVGEEPLSAGGNNREGEPGGGTLH